MIKLNYMSKYILCPYISQDYHEIFSKCFCLSI